MTDTNALYPSAALLEKLAGIVHTVLHEMPGGAADRLCRDEDVIAWAKAMDELGLMPDPVKR